MSNETRENKIVSLEHSTTVPSKPTKTTSDSIMITSPLTFTSNLPESRSELSTSTVFDVHATSEAAGNASFLPNQTLHNFTDDEKQEYLSYLQDRTTMAMIPAMTYLIILATVGLVGNSMVLFVYSRKFRPTSTRVFIMAIASFDIVTNVVAIPGEIYDMFHIWDFDQPMVCRTRLFFNAFTTMVAAMVLVAVAVVRYRKICKPFQTQVSVKLAKILSFTLAALSLTFSIPYAIINGRQKKDTPRKGIDGYECTIDDGYVNTIWPLMNSAFFIFLFVVCCVPLVVMYVLIGITAWKHSKAFGAVTYTKGKVESKSGDSGNSNDVSTRSTDESALKFTKTPKTRSFVKNKGDSPGGLPALSSQNSNDNKPHCYNNQVQDNKDRCHADKFQCNKCDDDNDADNVYDTSIPGKEKCGASKKTKSNNCDIRTVRSPTGETVHINLLMVKELTMKLKAVKKESESITDKNDDNCSEPWKADYEDKTFMSSIKTSEDVSDKTQNIDTEIPIDKSSADNVEADNRFVKKKIHRNKSADTNLYDEVGKLSTPPPSKRFSKSLGDLSRLTIRHSLEKDKKKAAENEDLDLRSNIRHDNAIANDHQELIENEDSEFSKDEPMSEFAKAMQWVDLTYCLTEDQKENENGKNEANGDEPDCGTLSKKGSFAIGRKISRDNSFLQRHKKLKDALSDTLTRARRKLKDRETADADGKDNFGDNMLENINSESDNVCNDDNDTDNGINERRISEHVGQHEAKAFKRKASRVKEDPTSDESGNTIQVTRHGAKRRGIGRTTCMLILISAVYILGFLPFLGLMFTKAASPNTFKFMDIPSEAVYNLFLRSYFLNSAANPIIYSLCDINFRRECLALLRRS